jgi:hypothetical protein
VRRRDVAAWKNVIAFTDWNNHAIMSYEEVSAGVRALARRGLVVAERAGGVLVLSVTARKGLAAAYGARKRMSVFKLCWRRPDRPAEGPPVPGARALTGRVPTGAGELRGGAGGALMRPPRPPGTIPTGRGPTRKPRRWWLEPLPREKEHDFSKKSAITPRVHGAKPPGERCVARRPRHREIRVPSGVHAANPAASAPPTCDLADGCARVVRLSGMVAASDGRSSWVDLRSEHQRRPPLARLRAEPLAQEATTSRYETVRRSPTPRLPASSG